MGQTETSNYASQAPLLKRYDGSVSGGTQKLEREKRKGASGSTDMFEFSLKLRPTPNHILC